MTSTSNPLARGWVALPQRPPRRRRRAVPTPAPAAAAGAPTPPDAVAPTLAAAPTAAAAETATTVAGAAAMTGAVVPPPSPPPASSSDRPAPTPNVMRTGVDPTSGTTADGGSYEYLDHTADVQIHSWGRDLPSAVGAAAVAMFGIITDLSDVVEAPEGEGGDGVGGSTPEELPTQPMGGGRLEGGAAGWPIVVDANGHDVKSAVFNFLDECLFAFCGDARVYRRVEVDSVDRVKAITYSAMQVTETPTRVDIYVIVDI
ncbi:hypothetical protein MMPV_003314 [Pyropia vietnamensis]